MLLDRVGHAILMPMTTIAEATHTAQQELALAEDRYWDAQGRSKTLGQDEQLHRQVDVAQAKVNDLQAKAGGAVFLIPTDNLSELNSKLAKLNKRAAKLDVAPVTITEHEVIEIKGQRKGEVIQKQYIAVKGQSPKLAGWQFVATLEHDENGVILRRLPTYEGAADLMPYRDASPENCDHCHLRRRRNDTYVIEHDNGSLKQVGSNCLVDFLGGQSPEQIARWCSYVADFIDGIDESDHEGSNGPQPQKRYDVTFYLTHVACMIRTYGWKSRGQAQYSGGATADAANDNIYYQATQKKDQGVPMWTDPIEADEATAVAAIEWVKTLTETDLENDYLYNLYTSLKGESIPATLFGIAASGISAHARAIEKAIKRQLRAEKPESQHIGTVGQRETFTLTITKIHWIADRYSYNDDSKPLIIMLDPSGNEVKWFASRLPGVGDTGNDPIVGGTYEVKASVKRHEDNPQYGRSTMITRAKFEKTINEPQEGNA